MISFKVWMITERHEILDHIKVPVKSVSQTKTFSCGNAALRTICQFYKVGPDDEDKFIEMMNSNSRDGTVPSHIVSTAREFGLCVKYHHNFTIRELKDALDKGHPIICPVQAHGKKKHYKKRESGHYIVVIGYDNERIYFEDPMIKGKRGYRTYNQFDRLWHDKDANGKLYDHYGIIIWKEDGQERDADYLTKAKKVK